VAAVAFLKQQLQALLVDQVAAKANRGQVAAQEIARLLHQVKEIQVVMPREPRPLRLLVQVGEQALQEVQLK